VRQGKRFELDVGEVTDPVEAATRIAQALLANPVIEDFTVRLEEPASG